MKIKPKPTSIDRQSPLSSIEPMQYPLSLTSRPWLQLFLKTGSAIALGLFLLVIVGLGYGQWWAKRNLSPMIAKELSKTLKRPISLGTIEDIWFNKIRISKATIPPHGRELNRLEVQEVVINFNPFKLAFDRTLKLEVHVVAPNIYLPQNSQGSWGNIPTPEKTPPGPVKIEVGTIKIDDGRIVVVPYSQSKSEKAAVSIAKPENNNNPKPITVSKINIQADVNDSQTEVIFNAGAQFEANGQVQIQGKSLIANGQTEVAVKGQKLDAAAATRIVKIPEVTIDRGTVDGDLTAGIEPGKYLRIGSNLLVHDGKLTINQVPRSLDKINGVIQVSEQDVKFNNVTTKYDRVGGLINGSLNYNTGYQLRAKTAPITLPDLLKSIDVKSPFPLVGAAVGELQLTGKLDRPILAGKFNNSQLSQVDRVEVDRVDGTFKLADGVIKLQAIAQPKLGGKVSTQGEIQLLKTPQTRFQVQGDNLPGDTLTQLYGAKLPPQVKLGNASVSGTIGGTGENIYTNLRVNAPQATYPVSTDLQITPQGNAIIRGATFQAAGGKVGVTGNVTATNWDLNLQPQDLDTQKLAKIIGTTLPANYGGKLAGSIQARGLNSDVEIDRIRAQGRLSLQLAAGQIMANRFTIDRGKWQANLSSNAIDLQELDRSLPDGVVSGNFNLSGNDLKKITSTSIFAKGGGKIKLEAGEIQSDDLTIANGNWQGIFTTDNLQLSKFNPQVDGKLSGKFNLAGNLQKFTPESIRGVGVGTLNLAQGKISTDKFQIDRGKWQGNLKLSSLVLGGLAPEIPLKFRKAKLDGNINVAGDLKHLKPQDISITGDGQLSFAGGTVAAQKLEVKSGKWRGNFAVDRLKLAEVSDELPLGFQSAKLTGNFNAAGELANFNPSRLQVSGNGEIDLADGKIRAEGLQLDRGNWSSNLAIANLRLGNINNQLPPQFQAARLTGNFNVSGNLDRLTPEGIQADGKGSLRLADGGKIGTDNFQIANGQWQSDIVLRGLRLGAVNSALPAPIQSGLLFGNFVAAGNLQEPGIERIEVRGNGKIGNILGGNIQVNNLNLNNGQWQSNAIADSLNVRELAKFAPNNSIQPNQIGGKLSANWQIAGNIQDSSPSNFRVLGQTKLTNLQVGPLKFDPNLIGNIQANPGQGVDIKFAGVTDRLSLALDSNLQLQNFAVKQQGTIASGSVNNQILNINVERFPVALIQPWIPKSAGIQQYRLAGIGMGDLAVNLANFHIAGKRIEIVNPTFGAFQGDRLLTDFRYANGQLNLDNTEIQRGTHSYLVNASVTPGAKTPTFAAKIQVPKGTLEDVRDLFQIFSLDDVFKPLNQRKYGTVADLATKTEKIANQPQPLYNELRRLSELRRWLKRETDLQQENTIIPNIGNLEGDFSGDIAIASNPKAGLTADFNLNGANWQLERYNLDRLQAQGNWRNGKLHLAPLSLTLKDSHLTLTGDFGANSQNANLNVKNFPAEWLTSLVELPVDINGGINLNAQITGNIGDPHISGDIALNNGKLNQTKLKSAAGTFNYWDGRLNFVSNATFADNLFPTQGDAINITGSIPYELPFSLKPPASNAIKVDLTLENQGLQMLDVFTKQQLHWIDGQGKVAVNISGKMNPEGGFESIVANGKATIDKARIKSIALPEPIRDVNGEIVFDFDRIDVQKLDGKFGSPASPQQNQGQIAISGIIPISDSFSIEPSKQLSILLKGIPIDLKEKYMGDVDGKLNIIGTALNPILTGELKLSNGQVFIPDSPNTTSTVLGIEPPPSAEEQPNSLQIRNLSLTLGDNLQITRYPLLNFVATGKLDLDGTIDNPRPFGQVQLQKGSINLFTTQFRLAGGYPQTADFFPTLGTEPVLNLRLYAKALESTSSPLTQRNSIARTSKNGEINETADFYGTSLGSVQTVQVEARIAGLASQVTERLELTSTPPRTQPEILLLLGGGLVERIGAGDNNIGLGIANLAGSTLLNNIQDRISDVLSLSDFRLFPTITKDSKSSASTLGIAAEVGTDITPKISTSVFIILTNSSETPQYSLRYRLNEQILLRGSTNLSGENRAIVEFERRF